MKFSLGDAVFGLVYRVTLWALMVIRVRAPGPWSPGPGLPFHARQAAAHLDEAIGQRRLAMVNVGDDGEIADMTQITHGSTLKKLLQA
jgi:hypothetical protein